MILPGAIVSSIFPSLLNIGDIVYDRVSNRRGKITEIQVEFILIQFTDKQSDYADRLPTCVFLKPKKQTVA